MDAETTRATPVRGTWLGWDGRTLRMQIDGGAAELHIDGVRFQSASQGSIEIEFPFSPSGRPEIEFGLSTAADGALTPWRVLHDVAATPGLNAWAGDVQPMMPLRPIELSNVDLQREIAVVVPIYNSPQMVQRCIASLLRWTPRRTRLILIDDASTDPEIAPLLNDAAKNKHVLVSRNASNRGYTHSVNVGMQLAGDADVVLLNSDTEVGPRWLQSLAYAAYSRDDIATSTAVSDNAGAFSVPDLERYCPIPERWDLPSAQRAVLQQAGLIYPQLPTGNGFCMFIKRRVIERIGVMDEQAFPQGYGEENDFCQRAERAGFRNVIAGNVLVRHARSASFGHERRATLGAQGMAVLRRRYPDYEADVGATLHSFERRALDYRVRRTYADRDRLDAPRPRVLVVSDAGKPPSPLVDRFETLSCRSDGSNLLRYGRGAWKTASATIHLVAYAIEGVLIGEGANDSSPIVREAAALDIPVITSAAPSEFAPIADGFDP